MPSQILENTSLESERAIKKNPPSGFNEKDFIIFRQNKNGRISGGGNEDRDGNEYTHAPKLAQTSSNFND